MGKKGYLALWLLTIFAGAGAAELTPDKFNYIIGFITGTLSFMFMRLSEDH